MPQKARRVNWRDREKFRRLGEAIARMEEEFPLPPATPEDHAWIEADLNRRRAERGYPPLEEDNEHASDRRAIDAARRSTRTD